MEEQLKRRLAELKDEFAKGQKTLAELETQTGELRKTLLRISGAIQVLEEELQKSAAQKDLPAPVGVSAREVV